MNDLCGIILISDTLSCIEGGSSEDHKRLIDEYVRVFEQYSFCGFSEMDSALTDNAARLMSSFAFNFPAEFAEKEIHNSLKYSVYSAAAAAIRDNSPAALTLLKKLDLKNMVHYERKWLLSLALHFRKSDCIRYMVNAINDTSALIFSEMLFYIYENSLTDILDIILEGRSEEEIKSFLIPDTSGFSLSHKKFPTPNYIDICYDICVRYIPRIRDSNNIPDAVSGFLSDIFCILFGNYCLGYDVFGEQVISMLSAMKRLGLYFSDITELVNNLAFNLQRPLDTDFSDKLKEHYFPVFCPKLTVRLFYFSSYFRNNRLQSSVSDILEFIGADRIYFDISSKALIKDSEIIRSITDDNRSTSLPLCRRLLKYGCGFITDDEPVNSKLSEFITMYPKLLGQLLRRCNFSFAQMTDLIYTAAELKRTDALNIINKFVIENKKHCGPAQIPDKEKNNKEL